MKHYKHTWISILLIGITILANCSSVFAATTTVTLKNGNYEEYGSYSTRIRWVTHINGVAVDLDEEPGVTRSYAYCVQPKEETPEAGTYNVTVVDDDDTGKVSKMRKMIYYLPGAYGYKKVTKSRWFSSLPNGTSAYTIGHVALSYLYDNCSSESDAWKGTNESIRNKVKSIIKDLDNLPDPPEDFEVFWIKTSGKQDTFGAFYSTEYGKAAIKKQSALSGISDGNACYTLAGAKYGVYENAECTVIAKTRNGGDAVITVNADGSSDVVEIETGDYYVKEMVAPRGYSVDTQVHSVKISKGNTATLNVADVPKSNPVDILIKKVDAETGESKPQGAATLAGAEFTVKYYDVTPGREMSEDDLLNQIKDKSPAKINGAEAKWVYRIVEDCKVDMQNPEKTLVQEESAGFYHDSKGRNVFPIGIITIQETKAPRGYLLNRKVYARGVFDEGSDEQLNNFLSLTGESAIDDQVYRGDIEFSKSSEGLGRMGYVPFRLTSLTTGESHVIVTDENGHASTSSEWSKHDNNTNEGNSDEDGIWFDGLNDCEHGAKPDNELGALPFDTYRLEELACDSNKGHSLFSDVITIKRNKVVVDLGTFDDKLIPEQISEKPMDESPKTGDSTQIFIYAVLGLLSAVELVLLTVNKKGGRLLNR